MPDQIFQDPRLVAIYDDFDGKRSDLDHYLAIVKEFKAKSILDVGCGTGCFACLLSEHGYDVIGIDPANNSLEIARKKPHADRVRWIVGDATSIPQTSVDMAVMTGNVAQVFLTDESWIENLISIKRALKKGGFLVFEARNPEKQAWLKWTRENSYSRLEIPDMGFVEGWCDVTNVSDELVSFRWTYTFESDGSFLSSDSTLRFRTREAIENSLKQTGYVIHDVRDAPDRPGQEFVFVATTL